MFEEIFLRRKLNIESLVRYGFQAKDDYWIYHTSICDDTFTLCVSVFNNGSIDTHLADNETGEPYVLYKTGASGTFVGEVRTEIEIVLRKIADECFESSVFKSEQASQIIEYVRDTYGDELEFLWIKVSDNAVWRRKDSNKWYGVILKVPGNKLGLPSNEVLEIIDLRLQKEQMAQTVDYRHFFPGWHMNKKSWYTIVLDHSVSTQEICRRIDESYSLAKK